MAKFSKIVVLSKINKLKSIKESILQKNEVGEYGSWIDNKTDNKATMKVKMRLLGGLHEKHDELICDITYFEPQILSTSELIVNGLSELQKHYGDRTYFYTFIDKVIENGKK